ncbi:ribosome-inactivating protein 3 [Brachypodium distachyon]|uniref:rRNA N-glycosylase n=1 Tax=Brachypodium distachyon TaxID=15368 RepID=C3SA73_BRADI|nr:ribosome-inactivating protein 3 [Brachypodium distachyon]ACF22707.1 ribosome inactivating protein [Brachypodium distachyon]KQK16468.1 hypothetical protein BRADI_1g28910v3 [Brachypodium distachyon]|eukprot:XP_010229689.1 ribosome-inactivating protein 3 [Brachypodium distachyon]
MVKLVVFILVISWFVGSAVSQPPPHATPQVVTIQYDLVHGSYTSFIDDLRTKLANHPSPGDINGHPLLTPRRYPNSPARWMHISISAGGAATTTLVLRDDTLYVVGFTGEGGSWYEFGFQGEAHQIQGSIFLECGNTYKDLVGGKSGAEVRMNLQGLDLGKNMAVAAVTTLSTYVQPLPPNKPIDATKLALAARRLG